MIIFTLFERSLRVLMLFVVFNFLSSPETKILLLCKDAPIEAGCSSDDECPSFQACVSRSCVNPCTTNNPCSQSARCSVTNHRAVCNCPPGTTGDPYTQCVPSKFLPQSLDYSKCNLLLAFRQLVNVPFSSSSQNWRV